MSTILLKLYATTIGFVSFHLFSKTNHNLCYLASIFLLTVSLPSLRGETLPGLPKQENPFLGAQSCSTSMCHGGADEMSRQFSIWMRADPHARAYATLTTARSQRMAESLGIEQTVSDAQCTACHAPLQTISSHLSSEGVSCEVCHGASHPWIRSHTRPDYTRAMCVAAGLRDLEDLYLRANTCVACHQTISKPLLDAGHPALHFELASQSQRQPRHWKEEHAQAQIWLVGQLTALREISHQLASTPSESMPPSLQNTWNDIYQVIKRLDRKDFPLSIKPPSDSAGYLAAVEDFDRYAKEIASSPWTTETSNSLLFNLLPEIYRSTPATPPPPSLPFRRFLAEGIRAALLDQPDPPSELLDLLQQDPSDDPIHLARLRKLAEQLQQRSP